ncbi:hypothetical protein L7F22_036947 [Adiantum nelumboides]|nr:hypothetical protein [Adiantum nelumboides]
MLSNIALAEGLLAEWTMHTIVPIHKSGDPLDPGTYRTIMIGHTLAKLYGAILEAELSSYAEHGALRAPGWLGLICPCVLFGRNVERLKEIPWTTPCTCHAIFVEGGLALAAATLAFHAVNPHAAFLIGEGLFFTWWMCGIYTGLFRQDLQKKYHLQNSPCDPCLVHCCMHWCALCQEHREMQGRLSDDVIMPMTIINPPPLQEMHVPEGPKTPSANGKDEGISVQVQAP